jgi:uncharacterized membrane protein YphA (DoxX/SURF4 family)
VVGDHGRLSEFNSMTAAGSGYCAAVVLAAIFATAGIAKLRDLRATLEQFTALGLPRPGVFTRIVPLAELALVTLLLIVPAVGAIFSMITLAFFTTFLVSRVRAGVSAPCACFGATVSTPLSWVDVVRNILLFLLSCAALIATRPVRPTVADLATTAAAVVCGAVILRVLRHR